LFKLKWTVLGKKPSTPPRVAEEKEEEEEEEEEEEVIQEADEAAVNDEDFDMFDILPRDN
jgi:hypothetical protein